MKRFSFFLFLLLFLVAMGIFAAAFFLLSEPTVTIYPKPNPRWWAFQSVDTMKHSRDLAREKLHDASYDAVIDREVRAIAETGATHVAIATPYDEEFVPYLKRWVLAARKYHLGVWFRGNFSGWEEWFGYQKVSRSEHIFKTQAFIRRHPDIFQDGDAFSACPECENGGPGDPRSNGDIEGYRKFLIDEYAATQSSFEKLGKEVSSNFFSMNGDIARLVMDKGTTEKLGGMVTVDHYVKTPEVLASDAQDFISRSDGDLLLGEFGAPIPDINGDMTDEQQSVWLRDVLSRFTHIPRVFGMSYWTQTGSSTALWSEKGVPRAAVATLAEFFSPQVFYGIVRDELGAPIAGAQVSSGTDFSTATNGEGYFELRVPSSREGSALLSVSAQSFLSQEIPGETTQMSIVLPREEETWWFRLEKWMRRHREAWQRG